MTIVVISRIKFSKEIIKMTLKKQQIHLVWTFPCVQNIIFQVDTSLLLLLLSVIIFIVVNIVITIIITTI